MEAVMNSMKDMGKLQIGLIVGVSLLLLGFFMMMAFHASSAGMSPLFTNLSMEDSAKIAAELDKTGVPFEISGGGSQISVASDKVLRLRLTMAEQGIPSGGSVVGYEIFDRSESFGGSNFVMNINAMRALEGELARTIASLNGVDSARVHLVVPKHELFTREKEKPSASVTIKMRGGSTLEHQEVIAITHLVSAAVPSMEASKVTVVDSHGKLLARGDGDESSGSASNAAEARIAYETRTQQTLEDLLEKVIGVGKVRVTVAADMNFDRTVVNSEKFDPEGQVARSVQSNNQKEVAQDKTGSDSQTVANNLPKAASGGEGSNSSTKDNNTTGEVTNFEISKTVQNQVKEGGNINKLSVAVLVDGTYPEDKDGKKNYTPRTPEELAQLKALVSSAVGYDEKRGDKIELVNMRFTNDVLDVTESSFFEKFRLEVQSIIQTLIISVVAILAILLVLRPAVSKMVRQIQPPSERIAGEMAALENSVAMRLPSGGGSMDSGGFGAGGFESAGGGDEQLIDVANVKGGMKSSSMSKVNEIVDKYPEETMNVLRQWITSNK